MLEKLATARIMVLDVEATHLHGTPVSAAYVIINGAGGVEVEDMARASEEEIFALIKKEVLTPEQMDFSVKHLLLKPKETPNLQMIHSAIALPHWLREAYTRLKPDYIAADVAYPVETNFMRNAFQHGPQSEELKRSPYPLLDVENFVMACGIDADKAIERVESELPVHNPLADARYSARKLRICLGILRERAKR